MASLIEELIDVLQKENEEYQKLLAISMEKTPVIVEGNITKLQEIVAREQEVVDVIGPLEKKRINVLNGIGNVLNKDSDKLSVGNLIKLMEKQPKFQKQLTDIHDALKYTLDQMVTVNENNKLLLQQSLELVEFDLNIMRGFRSVPETANYNKGAYNEIGSNLGRGYFDTKQ